MLQQLAPKQYKPRQKIAAKVVDAILVLPFAPTMQSQQTAMHCPLRQIKIAQLGKHKNLWIELY